MKRRHGVWNAPVLPPDDETTARHHPNNHSASTVQTYDDVIASGRQQNDAVRCVAGDANEQSSKVNNNDINKSESTADDNQTVTNCSQSQTIVIQM